MIDWCKDKEVPRLSIQWTQHLDTTFAVCNVRPPFPLQSPRLTMLFEHCPLAIHDSLSFCRSVVSTNVPSFMVVELIHGKESTACRPSTSNSPDHSLPEHYYRFRAPHVAPPVNGPHSRTPIPTRYTAAGNIPPAISRPPAHVESRPDGARTDPNCHAQMQCRATTSSLHDIKA